MRKAEFIRLSLRLAAKQICFPNSYAIAFLPGSSLTGLYFKCTSWLKLSLEVEMVPVPSQADILKAILAPSGGWSGKQITYSIPTAGSTWPGYSGFGTIEPQDPQYGVFSASQADAFRAAVAQIQRLVNINLVETNDLTVPGQIRIAFSSGVGHAYYPSSVSGAASQKDGDVWIDAAWKSFDLGKGPYFKILLHELEHALGIQHIHEGPYALPSEWNNIRFSVIAYNTSIDQIVYQVTGGAFPSLIPSSVNIDKPMVYDVLALQTLYGANPTMASGDTVYTWSQDAAYFDTIYDAGGNDTIDLTGHTRGSQIDLTPGSYSSIDYFSYADQKAYFKSLGVANVDNYFAIEAPTVISGTFGLARAIYTWANNVGIAFGTIIENVVAGNGDDVIVGNGAANIIHGALGADVIFGGAGNDHLFGDAGDDVLMGDTGDDVLDGGDGDDVARYAGSASDYSVTKTADGMTTVRDLRSGSPDGTDTLKSIEKITFNYVSLLSPKAIQTAFAALQREPDMPSTSIAQAQVLYLDWNAGKLSRDQAIAQIVASVGSTTSVATMAYAFFTGKIPTQVGVDYLVSSVGGNANNLKSAYYQSFNLENRYINFAVNLGKNGEGKASFAAQYGGLSLLDAAKVAYKAIFGATPTDALAHILVDTRVDYFAYYGGDGPNGIGTKAAMVGWLLAEAQKADLGVLAKSNDAWLTDLADGSAPFAVNILDPANGYYKADFIFGG